MQSTGIVRKVDPLGRITLPRELRRTLGLNESDPVEIFVDRERIVLRKYQPSCTCIFCGNGEDVLSFKNQSVCNKCRQTLAKGA